MSERRDVAQFADRLAHTPPDIAREAWAETVTDAHRQDGPALADGLQFNALLATALRERNVPIWGDGR